MYSINPDANFTSERDTWEAFIIELQEENEIINATLSLIEEKYITCIVNNDITESSESLLKAQYQDNEKAINYIKSKLE
jgi:uncharacterized metal-binding protein